MVKQNYTVPKIFKFEDNDSGRYWQIRLVGTTDMPEWIFSDVSAVLYPNLDIEDHADYFATIPDPWKSQKPVMTPDGEQLVSTLYEAGLYYLIAQSNSPLMLPFQQWITREILPVIRHKKNHSVIGTLPADNPSVKDKLETIRLGMDLLYELGGIDDYIRLAIREQVREILLDNALQSFDDLNKKNRKWHQVDAKSLDSLSPVHHNNNNQTSNSDSILSNYKSDDPLL
jgi:prophage antirepressor-like protein